MMKSKISFYFSLYVFLSVGLHHLQAAPPQYNVGVFYQPSWNFKPSSGTWVDSMWSCLEYDYKDCSFVMPGSPTWGPKGRIYTNDDPRPDFGRRQPVPELGGFYSPTNPEVIKKQLSIMKNHEIDYFIYNWFWGRHYYYQVPDQFNTYYPNGWAIDSKNFGRVKVPGIEQWAEQLHSLLQVNDSLPASEQLKFALNWCDDSNDRWMGFLNIGSPGTLERKENFIDEKPTAALFMETHKKMVHLWADKYFVKPNYLRDEKGRPVVYFYFPQDVEARASLFNISMKQLIDEANKVAISKGFPGIKFIAVLAGAMHVNDNIPKYGLPTKWVPIDPAALWKGGDYTEKISMQKYADSLIQKGFEGMTSYVYHSYSAEDNNPDSRNLFNESFDDMANTYRAHWNRWVEKFKVMPNFDYQIPVAMGWDNRPNGGTWYDPSKGEPTHRLRDFGHGSKVGYKALLTEAKIKSNFMKRNITLCCWNEYTEGNYIEPTVGTGYMFVEAIKEVFGPQVKVPVNTGVTTPILDPGGPVSPIEPPLPRSIRTPIR